MPKDPRPGVADMLEVMEAILGVRYRWWKAYMQHGSDVFLELTPGGSLCRQARCYVLPSTALSHLPNDLSYCFMCRWSVQMAAYPPPVGEDCRTLDSSPSEIWLPSGVRCALPIACCHYTKSVSNGGSERCFHATLTCADALHLVVSVVLNEAGAVEARSYVDSPSLPPSDWPDPEQWSATLSEVRIAPLRRLPTDSAASPICPLPTLELQHLP